MTKVRGVSVLFFLKQVNHETVRAYSLFQSPKKETKHDTVKHNFGSNLLKQMKHDTIKWSHGSNNVETKL